MNHQTDAFSHRDPKARILIRLKNNVEDSNIQFVGHKIHRRASTWQDIIAGQYCINRQAVVTRRT